jgi:multisubunit Na+/H+ antiporter MnhE subunit
MHLRLLAAFSLAGFLLSVFAGQAVLATSDSPRPLSDKWKWERCGPSLALPYLPFPLLSSVLDDVTESPVDITAIVVTPDPPEPGKNLTVHVEADVKQTIEVDSLLFRLAKSHSSIIHFRKVPMPM